MFCFEIIKGGIPSNIVAIALKQAEELQATAAQILAQHGPLTASQNLIPPLRRFAPTASSMNADALKIHRELISVAKKATVKILEKELQNAGCNLDLSWLRKQYPPASRPAGQSPHNWHQDGACGLQLNHLEPDAKTELSQMITLWIPLNHCGIHAPSIELIPESPQDIIYPSRFVNSAKSWEGRESQKVKLSPGDLLVMAGHCVHRTHVTEEMTLPRHCVEFRFLDCTALPSRFSRHQFI